MIYNPPPVEHVKRPRPSTPALVSESHDLEAQERAARAIGDRQAAAKARARREEIADRWRGEQYGAWKSTHEGN